LNHHKRKKAEPSQLIPRKLADNLEFSNDHMIVQGNVSGKESVASDWRSILWIDGIITRGTETAQAMGSY